jgi:hypothetical protein
MTKIILHLELCDYPVIFPILLCADKLITLKQLMEQLQKTPPRKKFLLWGAALLSGITISKYFVTAKKSAAISCGKKTTVKMLTQDGSLVEVDKQILASTGKKITNEEMQQWIKK